MSEGRPFKSMNYYSYQCIRLSLELEEEHSGGSFNRKTGEIGRRN